MAKSISELVGEVVASGGSAVRAAARLMSLVEDEPHRLPELFQAAGRLPEAVRDGGSRPSWARLQPRLLVGITGAPGSGKSTLVDALVREHRTRWPDRRVGVVAVDPSSPFTGGAVLGDRVRMMRHATDSMVFVRSVASRGHLGGLALGVKGIVRVMGLAGCDTVFLETVGVGQSEVEVARVADIVVIVLAPGQGDSVQLLKAGLMEAGDLFVVNKADRPEAALLHSQVVAMLHLGSPLDMTASTSEDAASHAHHSGAAPGRGTPAAVSVLLASATDGQGIGPLVDALEARAGTHTGEWHERRKRQAAHDVREAVLEAARRRLERQLDADGSAADIVGRLLEGDASVDDEAAALLARTSDEAKRGAAD